MTEDSEYPVHLAIDYPDRPLNRLTTFFRPFTAIPIIVMVVLLAGTNELAGRSGDGGWSLQYPVAGLVVLPTVLMLLFRQKYPRWWFDWNVALLKFCNRIGAYMGLLRDEYPSTDEEQAVHIEIPYPDAKEGLNRWLPLVKWLLAIPHYIVLLFLGVAAIICIVVAWFAILFTGRYPRDLFEFVEGVYRWELRVTAYAFLLTTDRYPPFRLDQ